MYEFAFCMKVSKESNVDIIVASMRREEEMNIVHGDMKVAGHPLQ